MTAPHSAYSARSGWLVWMALAVGAFIGTESRYVLGILLPETTGAFPWTTFGINMAGSFLLGVLTGSWTARPGTARWLEVGLGPGLLGSFTTFSAVSLIGVTEPELLLPYLGLSLAFGLAFAVAGVVVGQRAAA